MDRTALVPGGDIAAELGLVVAFEEDELAARDGASPLAVNRLIAVVDVGSRRHVADIDVAVLGEAGVERHADQPASQELSTSTVTNGSGRSVPSLTTRSARSARR